MPKFPDPTRANMHAAPLLESALLFTFCAHAAAMFSMFLLMPGLPGANATTIAARAGYVAGHRWLWRGCWLPWQMTAISDLALCIALLKTRWIPRLPALLAAVATIIAIIPDQGGQFRWTWIGTSLARDAVLTGNFIEYARFESQTFRSIAGWGALGYIAGALFWTWCFAAAGVWSKRLTFISIAAWGVFSISTAALLFAESAQAGSMAMIVVSMGNAVAFVLLMLWLMGVSEAVLARSRPVAMHGLYAPFRFPARGLFPRLFDLICNSRFARALIHLIPVLTMDSDITDVIYVNYLVEAPRLAPFEVAPLKLQTLGPDGRYSMFTFLTFRHGHFGPRCFGPLRRLWPSPIQSNWRIYVYDPITGKRGIQFLTIASSAKRYALAARLMAENVPMHVPASAAMRRTPDGMLHLQIDPGEGSAPDIQATFQEIPQPALAPPWDLCFGTWREMLAYCVPQDRAMSAQPWLGRVARQEITLNIPLETCRPLAGTVISKAASAIVGNAAPVCFFVEQLSFRLLKEEFDVHSIIGS
jgi:hypothetical protein